MLRPCACLYFSTCLLALENVHTYAWECALFHLSMCACLAAFFCLHADVTSTVILNVCTCSSLMHILKTLTFFELMTCMYAFVVLAIHCFILNIALLCNIRWYASENSHISGHFFSNPCCICMLQFDVLMLNFNVAPCTNVYPEMAWQCWNPSSSWAELTTFSRMWEFSLIYG